MKVATWGTSSFDCCLNLNRDLKSTYLLKLCSTHFKHSLFFSTWEIQLSKALDKWNSNGVVFEGEKNSANPLKETEFADLLLQSRVSKEVHFLMN